MSVRLGAMQYASHGYAVQYAGPASNVMIHNAAGI